MTTSRFERWLRTGWVFGCACALAACQATTRPVRPAAPLPSSTEAPVAADPAPSLPATPAPIALPTYLIPEPDSPRTGAELFDRLTARFADATCPDEDLVQRWQTIYSRSPTRFAAQIENVLPLMSLALDEAERYRLPGELVLLPIVESWYRPDAGAGSGHVGLWQFGEPTARGLGLTVRGDYDARMAPFAATDAAFRHLADLHNDFGDWKLANMGFNAGAYRLQKILDRTPAPRISADDRQPAGLSATTYEHLAKVQALACLLSKPARFGLELPRDAIITPLTTVTLPAGASTLSAIAHAAELDPDELRILNPAFRRGVVSAQAGRELLLPRDDAARFAQFTLPKVAMPAAAPATAASGSSHTIRNGDTLGAIARHYKLRLRDLLTWNGLTSRSVLRPGQRIRLEP